MNDHQIAHALASALGRDPGTVDVRGCEVLLLDGDFATRYRISADDRGRLIRGETGEFSLLAP